ncbi:hypothetical protein KAT24_01680 [Candidatus Pacearchaeota archaeon]|nr:hypothetical protein [Candidatus Pacearchaeota archaeon]
MEERKLKMLEKFIDERLPEAEKNRIILIVDNKPLSWVKMLEELKKGGKFATKVEYKFEEMMK